MAKKTIHLSGDNIPESKGAVVTIRYNDACRGRRRPQAR